MGDLLIILKTQGQYYVKQISHASQIKTIQTECMGFWGSARCKGIHVVKKNGKLQGKKNTEIIYRAHRHTRPLRENLKNFLSIAVKLTGS